MHVWRAERAREGRVHTWNGGPAAFGAVEHILAPDCGGEPFTGGACSLPQSADSPGGAASPETGASASGGAQGPPMLAGQVFIFLFLWWTQRPLDTHTHTCAQPKEVVQPLVPPPCTCSLVKVQTHTHPYGESMEGFVLCAMGVYVLACVCVCVCVCVCEYDMYVHLPLHMYV